MDQLEQKKKQVADKTIEIKQHGGVQLFPDNVSEEMKKSGRIQQEGELQTSERAHIVELENEYFPRHMEALEVAPANQMADSATKSKAQRKRERASSEGRYSGLKDAYGKLDGGLMQHSDMVAVENLLQSEWAQKEWLEKRTNGVKQRELLENAKKGNYSKFEDLDNVLCCYLATKFMQDNPLPQGEAPAQTVRSLIGRAEDGGTDLSAVMHPLFRLGISLSMRGDDGEYYKQLDTACGTAIMTETLAKQMNEVEVIQLAVERGVAFDTIREESARAQASQIFMAKNLLLAHMADFKRLDTVNVNGRKTIASTPWDIDVSAAFTHCSRVSYIMPTVSEQNTERKHNAFWQAMDSTRVEYSKSNGDRTTAGNGLFKRGGSTHNLSRRKVGGGDFKEKKTLMNLFGQKGMNVAVGGYGNVGIGSKLLNDGSCGHIYTMRKDSDSSHNGAFLVGFESDAHKKTNQLGHTHGLGNGERVSSFGGQRVDEIGNKYGGRQADLSNVSMDMINEYTLVLEYFMKNAFAEKSDIHYQMSQLAGPKMNAEQLATFIDRMRLR